MKFIKLTRLDGRVFFAHRDQIVLAFNRPHQHIALTVAYIYEDIRLKPSRANYTVLKSIGIKF